MVQLLFAIFWAWLCLRLIAFGATVRNGTLGYFFVAGALIGPAASRIISLTLDPYGWSKTGGGGLVSGIEQFVLSLVVQALILLPIALPYLRRRVWIASSICDACLIAFAAGLGADALSFFFTEAFGGKIPALSLVPPWSFSVNFEGGYGTALIGGYAYWSGLTMLAVAGAQRFMRHPAAPLIAGAIALSWCAAEHTVLTMSRGSALPFLGYITVWSMLIGLGALAWYESRWCAAPAVYVRDLSEALQLLAAGQIGRVERVRMRRRIERRVQIVKAQVRDGIAEPRLAPTLLELQNQHAALAELGAPQAPERTLRKGLEEKRLQILLWLLLVAISQAPLSRLFAAIGVLWWPTPFFNLNVLATALVLSAIYAYVRTAPPDQQAFDVDGFLKTGVARTARIVALGGTLLLLFFSTIYGPANVHPIGASFVAVPDATPALWTVTLALFYLTAMSNVSRPLAGLGTERQSARESGIFAQNISLVAATFLMLWINVNAFSALRLYLHQTVAGTWFATFGYGVQNLLDILATIATFGLTYALYRLLRGPSNWIERVIAPPRSSAIPR